jgi:hypothetical protein
MKHIKTYTLFERVSKETKLFESAEETSKWISEVMNTCKDLMLDLEDVGIETDVKRSLHPDEFVLIECTIKLKNYSIKKAREVGLLEIKDRLIDYMESEGFELFKTNEKSTSWSFTNDGKLKIIFKKSDIDNDYIGYLRYLKRYNIE